MGGEGRGGALKVNGTGDAVEERCAESLGAAEDERALVVGAVTCRRGGRSSAPGPRSTFITLVRQKMKVASKTEEAEVGKGRTHLLSITPPSPRLIVLLFVCSPFFRGCRPHRGCPVNSIRI